MQSIDCGLPFIQHAAFADRLQYADNRVPVAFLAQRSKFEPLAQLNQTLVVMSGVALPVAPAQPAIFGPPTGSQGYVFGPNGLADQNLPATAGDTVVIYCAGLGAVD